MLYALFFIICELSDQDIYHSSKASLLQIIRMATPSVFITVLFCLLVKSIPIAEKLRLVFLIMKSLSKNCCKIVGHYQVPLTREVYLLMNEQKKSKFDSYKLRININTMVSISIKEN